MLWSFLIFNQIFFSSDPQGGGGARAPINYLGRVKTSLGYDN